MAGRRVRADPEPDPARPVVQVQRRHAEARHAVHGPGVGVGVEEAVGVVAPHQVELLVERELGQQQRGAGVRGQRAVAPRVVAASPGGGRGRRPPQGARERWRPPRPRPGSRPLLTDGTLAGPRGSGVVARARRLLCRTFGEGSVSSSSGPRRKRLRRDGRTRHPGPPRRRGGSARTPPARAPRRARPPRGRRPPRGGRGPCAPPPPPRACSARASWNSRLAAHLLRAAALVLQPPRTAAPDHEEKGGQRHQHHHGNDHDQEGAHFPVPIRP